MERTTKAEVLERIKDRSIMEIDVTDDPAHLPMAIALTMDSLTFVIIPIAATDEEGADALMVQVYGFVGEEMHTYDDHMLREG